MCDIAHSFSVCSIAHLLQVEDSWKSIEFVVLSHRDQKDVFILGGTDDVQVVLDDSQVWWSVIQCWSERHVNGVGDSVHHSWIKTCRSHQTSCGGMGKTVVIVLRDNGMRLALL